MRPRGRIRMRRSVYGIAALSLLALAACHKSRVPALALEECDPAGYVQCLQQRAFVSIPVTDTGAYLTYSSRWAPSASGQHIWDASGLGLGGWSINLLQHYDKTNRLFISGDGSWRLTDSVALPSGETVVPSYDGSAAYIFDAAGRHVRTVDGLLGNELAKISYDSAGHLLKFEGFSNGRPILVSVQRDPNGAPKVLLGIDGGRTELALDGNQHLVEVTNPARETTRMAWNPAGLIESVTDAAGDAERFTYDSSGRLASAIDADSVTKHFDRKDSGDSLEISLTTELGRVRRYRAEFKHDEITRTFIAPDGTKNTLVTDARGNRSITRADGTTLYVGAVPNP